MTCCRNGTTSPAPCALLIDAPFLTLNNVPISDLSCLQNSAFWALSLRNLPARDLSPLFTSRWLVTLRVEGMNVQDLRWVGKFEHINRIFAPRNPIRSLNGLEAIKSRVMNVDVSQTQVSDLSPIQGATHLRWIELNDTRVINLCRHFVILGADLSAAP
jgi:hypothetical protein